MEEKSRLEEYKFKEIPKDLLSRGNLITKSDGLEVISGQITCASNATDVIKDLKESDDTR